MRQFDVSDLEPVRLPFTHDGRRYVLCEATEGDVEAWRSFKWQGATVKDDGTVEDMKRERVLQSGSYLVSLCLYDALLDGSAPMSDGNLDRNCRVSHERVLALPARLVDRLILEAMTISDLLAKEDQQALEKAFTEVVGKLAALSDDAGEKQQWREWMASEVSRVVDGTTPGANREPAKNGRPPATPVPSA